MLFGKHGYRRLITLHSTVLVHIYSRWRQLDSNYGYSHVKDDLYPECNKVEILAHGHNQPYLLRIPLKYKTLIDDLLQMTKSCLW